MATLKDSSGEVPPDCHNSMLPLPATTASLKVATRLPSGGTASALAAGLVPVITGAAEAGTKTAADVAGDDGLVSV